jgi:cellulose biosynthesis protein BcsQ
MNILTFFNNKGGVGKTTLAVNIAAYLSKQKRKKILFLDLDPQANSTQLVLPEDKWIEIYGRSASRKSVIDYFDNFLVGDSSIKFFDVPIKQSDSKYYFDLVPGHPRLSLIEDILSDSWNKCTGSDIGGFRKTNWLNCIKQEYKNEYDLILVDVGPSLGALNRTILLNSDYFLTPMGSDIFSILGIENISSWMKNWKRNYETSLVHFNSNQGEKSEETIRKYHLNIDPNKTTRFIGYSVQQYITRSFKSGRRPIKAYDEIISQIPDEIISQLKDFIKEGLNEDAILLGDVPFLYSIVPLSQSYKVPIFDLDYGNGIRGNQKDNVIKYTGMIDKIVEKIFSNIGEKI